ncbi:MAG: carbohydrate-binding family V/XII, partial [Gaiellaceae bacterium]
MRLKSAISCASFIVLMCASLAHAADKGWPREMDTSKGKLTIYQPQPDSLVGNVLNGRCAISLLMKGKSAPIFGVFWFTGRVDTDRDSGQALLRDIKVTNARWPESTKEKETELTVFLTDLMPKTGIPISMARLETSLAAVEKERKSVEGLKHDPPKIVFANELSQLVLYDGKPRTMPIEKTELEYVANCVFAVIKDKKTGTYYLSGGKTWYSANDPLGPWTNIAAPPADVQKVMPPDTSKTPAPAKPPKLVTATEPTELISTDGPAKWEPVGKEGALLYITNTESKVVKEVATGNVFVLASGRWFKSKTLEGPWAVVRPDELPKGFSEIPPASSLGSARVAVAGTPEAEDAMLDAQVPQTAAIERSKAKLEVKYDGDPKFKKIEGTNVEYATNTSEQVLK